jgi:two-component system response regulator LytT
MKVLIIEDETLAAKRLRRMLLEIDPVLEIPDALDSIESAVEWWGENPQPDLLFLDIHLADGSSFELFSLLTITKPVIFVTAYDQYAIQAFKVNAVDYLLKPIRKEELIQAYDKYRTLTSRIFDYERLVHAITPKHP